MTFLLQIETQRQKIICGGGWRGGGLFEGAWELACSSNLKLQRWQWYKTSVGVVYLVVQLFLFYGQNLSSCFQKWFAWLKENLIAPATNLTSERRFSILKRVKTLILSTMTDSRLNRLLMTTITLSTNDLTRLQWK